MLVTGYSKATLSVSSGLPLGPVTYNLLFSDVTFGIVYQTSADSHDNWQFIAFSGTLIPS